MTDKPTPEQINRFLEQGSPFHRLLQAEVVSIDDESAVCRVPLKEAFFHGGGVVHGGITFALADSAVAMLLLYRNGFDRKVFTIEGKLNYMASVAMGTDGELSAQARLVNQGNTTAVADADVYGPDGRHLCHGVFTYAIR